MKTLAKLFKREAEPDSKEESKEERTTIRTEFDVLARDLRTLCVKPKIIEEFERIYRQYPDSATIGFDFMRSCVSNANNNPDLGKSGLELLESFLLGYMANTVMHATGTMPNLSYLLRS